MSPVPLVASEPLRGPIGRDWHQKSLDDRHDYLVKSGKLKDLSRVRAEVMIGGDLQTHRFNLASYACGINPLTGERYHTTEDFASWWQEARDRGALEPRLGGDAIGLLFRLEVVPNVIIRRRVEHLIETEQETYESISGQIPDELVADGDYLSRLLGIRLTETGRGPSFSWKVSYAQAASLCLAIGLTYQEVGV